MRVGRTDHAELVRIHPQLLLELQAGLQRCARVLALQHLVLLALAQVEVGLVPDLEAGELVVLRKEGVRLAVALDLGRLVQRLPVDARLRVLARQRLLARRVDVPREHHAVRQVAVVGDRQYLSAGLVLVGLQYLPQVFRRRAAGGRIGGEGLDLAGLVAAVAVDHHPVQVVARRHLRGPLVADEGGELAGLVVFLRRIDGQLPGRGVGRRPGDIHQRLGKGAARELVDDLERCGVALPGLDHVVPFLAGGIGEEFRLPSEQVREESHVVRVVGDDEEIERTRQLRLLSARSRHFLAAGEAVGVLDAEAVAESRRHPSTWPCAGACRRSTRASGKRRWRFPPTRRRQWTPAQRPALVPCARIRR